MMNEEHNQKILNEINTINQKSDDFLQFILYKEIPEGTNKNIKKILKFCRDKAAVYLTNILIQEQLDHFEDLIVSLRQIIVSSLNNRQLPIKALNDLLENFLEFIAMLESPEFQKKILKNLSQEHQDKLLERNQQATEQFLLPNQKAIDPKKVFGPSDQEILIQDLQRRIENIENIPSETLKSLKQQLKDAEISSNSVKHIEKEIQTFHTKLQDYINNTKDEFEMLKVKGDEVLNRNISLALSDQFQEKAKLLEKEAENKLGAFSLKPWELKGFRGAIQILLSVNLIALGTYIYHQNEIDFWYFLMLKLTIIIPLILYVFFTLNEYTKAKKSYEEFDYKRIMAITLVNNYTTLKKDLGLDNDEAFELIKTPFEKIFDNPVHSIYGDKSGDKNIGIDQLEKVASILTKLKPNNP